MSGARCSECWAAIHLAWLGPDMGSLDGASIWEHSEEPFIAIGDHDPSPATRTEQGYAFWKEHTDTVRAARAIATLGITETKVKAAGAVVFDAFVVWLGKLTRS